MKPRPALDLASPHRVSRQLAAALACAVTASCAHDDPLELAPHHQQIVGGSLAAPYEFPFSVALSEEHTNCMGVLVAPTLVLTSARCTLYTSGYPPGTYRVVIGRYKLSVTNLGTVHAVSEVLVHPRYVDFMEGYDVAFLRLATPSSAPTVEIASPYGPSDRALWRTGSIATIIGYGTPFEFPIYERSYLRKVRVPIVDDLKAMDEDWYGEEFRPSTMVAAGYPDGGKGTCWGDGGAPLLVPSANDWKVAGVMSWSQGCAEHNRPDVYTRLADQRTHRWVKSIVHETPHVGDVNGDGKADIVTFTHGSQRDVYVALSTGSGFAPSSIWHHDFAHAEHLPMLGDFNGDGKADLFAFTQLGDVAVALSTGSSFGGGNYRSSVVMDLDAVPVVGDINGDGRDDVIVLSGDEDADVFVMRSTDTGFGPLTKWHDTLGRAGETPELADVDGDGKDDLVVFRQEVDGSGVWVARSSGTTFGPASSWEGFFALPEEMPGAGDFDGDGDDDVVAFTRNAAAKVYVGSSNRTRFFSALWSHSFGGPRGTYRVGDVNGDGRADILRFTQDSAADVFVRLSTGTGFGAEALWHGWFAP